MGDGEPSWELLVPARSLLAMTSPSRYGYMEVIKGRKTDAIDGEAALRKGRLSHESKGNPEALHCYNHLSVTKVLAYDEDCPGVGTRLVVIVYIWGSATRGYGKRSRSGGI